MGCDELYVSFLFPPYDDVSGITVFKRILNNKRPVDILQRSFNSSDDSFKDFNQYINDRISVDCDCDAHQGDPVMEDLGIIASLDPVANDQAFIDMLWNSTDPGHTKMMERVDRQEGRHITEYAEEIGLGSTKYELIEI